MSAEKRFLLRLDPRVYRALRRWADDELRSVNGQIEFLLRRALRDAGRAAEGEKPEDPGKR
ncbi:MAG TPA: hypothetical protein VFS92_09475 [Planctomycetota bacterium]|nr:hypothetical protein [Planctomycetota bacterium]